MPTIGVRIEVPDGIPNAKEFAAELAILFGNALLGVEGGVAVQEIVPVVETTSPYEGDGGENNLRKLMGEIAPNTRKALHVIATANLTGGPIHAIALRDALGAGSPSQVAGYLTSLGFAEKRTGLPKPYKQHWAQEDGAWGNSYTRTAEVAHAVVAMVNPDGSIKPTA